jgi:hypothetical protein
MVQTLKCSSVTIFRIGSRVTGLPCPFASRGHLLGTNIVVVAIAGT